MRDTSSGAPEQHPSRRAVLKVGANAAWAVPAIQIASATPAFAAGTTSIVHSKLAVSITKIKNPGNSGKIDVSVSYSASIANAKNVTLTLSGGQGTANVLSQDYSFTVGPLTAGAAAGTYTFNAQLKSGRSTGTVTVSINGDTDQTQTTGPVPAEGASDSKAF